MLNCYDMIIWSGIRKAVYIQLLMNLPLAGIVSILTNCSLYASARLEVIQEKE
jgi:hypothetical protein